MRLTRSAFTFVELIVVLVIIAILSTIGFTVYESYLWTGRDTKRIVQMKELQTAFQEYSFREKLPLPVDSIQLRASWSLYAYQGYISEDILKQLSFKANVYDDTTESYPVYLLWTNQKDFQFLTYLEDPASTAYIQNAVYATTDLRTLFPKTFGKALWVLLEQETNIPLQDISAIKSAGYYDVVSGTGMISAYLSEQKILESDQDDLRQLLPQNSCKRIMELGYSKWSGEYTISPDGITKVQVYCDMDIDGGWWTLVAFSSINGAYNNENFGWWYKTWDFNQHKFAYSIWENVKKIHFSSLGIGLYDNLQNINLVKNIQYFLEVQVDDSVLSTDTLWENTYATSGCETIKWIFPPNVCSNYNYWWRFNRNSKFFMKWANNLTSEHWLWNYKYFMNETAFFDEKTWILFVR